MVSQKQVWLIIAIAVLVVTAIMLFQFFGIAPQAATAQAKEVGVPITTGVCAKDNPVKLDVSVYDADLKGTSLGAATVKIIDKATGKPISGTDVNPDKTYTLLVKNTDYISLKTDIQIPCVATYSIPVYLKAYDTAIIGTVYNKDTYTENGVGNELVIKPNSVGTARIIISQSASYLHLSGVDDKFAVYVTVADNTGWDASNFAVTFDGKACTEMSKDTTLDNKVDPAYLAAIGTIKYKAVCSGDFTPNGAESHTLIVKLATDGTGIVQDQVFVDLIPLDYYENTKTGEIEVGAVSDNGSILQTPNTAMIEVAP